MMMEGNDMRLSRKKNFFHIYIFLILLGIVMVYPLLWLIASSFKTNKEIFTSISIIPTSFIFDAYIDGWKGSGQYTFAVFFKNTFLLVIPTVLFTIVSSLTVGYGFTRFDFPMKKGLFGLMVATLMLPNAIIMIPRYILFRDFDWLNTYLPFYIPAILATNSFFNFMMVQFLRGIPQELDESATIDGCGPYTILSKIIVPLAKPAIFSAGIFQFIWTWNDFTNALIYINSVKKYPVALGLRMSIDVSGVNWNNLMAMSVLAMFFPIAFFFLAQKYFVEGIATVGIKG
jgi:oligogalacturonide transport system permease protein